MTVSNRQASITDPHEFEGRPFVVSREQLVCAARSVQKQMKLKIPRHYRKQYAPRPPRPVDLEKSLQWDRAGNWHDYHMACVAAALKSSQESAKPGEGAPPA